VIFNALREINK